MQDFELSFSWVLSFPSQLHQDWLMEGGRERSSWLLLNVPTNQEHFH